MCTKINHKTTWGAAQHILYIEKEKLFKGKVTKMGVYKCEKCGNYHVTSHISKDCLFYKNIKNG